MAQASAFGDGDAVGEHESPIRLRDKEIHYDGHGAPDAERVFGNVGAEERLGDDFERESHHVGVDVTGFAGLPCCEH